jgi:hypothetical protein
VDKSRKVRWATHAAWREIHKMHTKFWLEDLKGKEQLEDTGTDCRLILEWMLEK